MSGISTNRSNITLPTEVSSEIIQKMQESSAVMRLARRITLPGRGLTIPMITSDPEAGWVAETAAKPVSNPGLGVKLIQAYKLAVIVPFSDEFLRDMRTLYDAIVARLPNALGYKFDQTVIGAVNKPGENFDNFAACSAQSLIGDEDSVNYLAYNALVAAYTDIAENGGTLNGFALSPAAVGILLNATDLQGRPLFINSVADSAIPRILGAGVYQNTGLYKAGEAPGASDSGAPAVVGIAGDWSKAMYGTVEGIKISTTSEATITIDDSPVNLWEHNMTAIRAEIEVGFRADTACFNQLLGSTPTAD